MKKINKKILIDSIIMFIWLFLLTYFFDKFVRSDNVDILRELSCSLGGSIGFIVCIMIGKKDSDA